MSDDLLSSQAVVVSGSSEHRDLLRQAAAAATLPIEIIEADGAASACRFLTADVDLVLLDAALASEEIARVAAAVRAAARPPFTCYSPKAPAPGRSRPTVWPRSPRTSKKPSTSWRACLACGCRAAY